MDKPAKSLFSPLALAAAVLLMALGVVTAVSYTRIDTLEWESRQSAEAQRALNDAQRAVAAALETAKTQMAAQQEKIAALENATAPLTALQDSAEKQAAANGQLAAQVESLRQALASVEKKLANTGDALRDMERRDPKLTILSLSDKLRRLGEAVTYLVNSNAPSSGKHDAPVSFAALPVLHSKLGGVFDGNGGRDVLKGLQDRELYFDGAHIISMEDIQFDNSVPNNVFVRAPGLNFLEDDRIEMTGDKTLDTVTLDGCLKWTRQKAKKGDTAATWIATDKTGATRRLVIRNGMPVTVEKTCDNRYAQQLATREFPLYWRALSAAINDLPAATRYPGAGSLKKNADARQGAPALPRILDGIRPYNDDPAILAAQYRAWAAQLPEEKLAQILQQLARLMDKRKLPTVFITNIEAKDMPDRAAIAAQLSFDPSALARVAGDGNTCADGQQGSGGAAKTTLLTGDGMHMTCGGGGNLLVFSGGADDDITAASDTFNLVAPGAGNDAIAIRNASALVYLDPQWGRKKITGGCRSYAANDSYLYLQGNAETAFGGIGLPLKVQDANIVAGGAPFPGSPAAGAGVKEGDILLSVNGVSLRGKTVNDVVNMIRGPIGTSLRLRLRRAGGGEENISLQRALIGVPQHRSAAIQNVQRIDYRWPYPHDNFIVFGPGISRADMKETTPDAMRDKPPPFKQAEWLNTKTGDTLALPGCYNFVFADE